MEFNISECLYNLSKNYSQQENNVDWNTIETTVKQYAQFLFTRQTSMKELRDLKARPDLQNYQTINQKITCVGKFLQSKIVQASDKKITLSEEDRKEITQIFQEIASANKIPTKTKIHLTNLEKSLPTIIKISELFIETIRGFRLSLNRDTSKEFRSAINHFKNDLFPTTLISHKSIKELQVVITIPELKSTNLNENLKLVSNFLTGLALRIYDKNGEYTLNELMQTKLLLHELKKKAGRTLNLMNLSSKMKKSKDICCDLEKRIDNFTKKFNTLEEELKATKEPENLDSVKKEILRLEGLIQTATKKLNSEQLELQLNTQLLKNFAHNSFENSLTLNQEEYELLKHLHTEPREVINAYLSFVKYIKEEIQYQPEEIPAKGWFISFWG